MDTRRSRPGRFASVALLLTAAALTAPAAVAQVPVPTAPPTAAVPSCHTVDSSGQPATLFAPGDRVIVQGEGYGLVSAIRITFVQGTRTLPLTIAYSDELGVFSTARTDSKIPATAAPGPGSIHAFSTTKVATCAVQVMAAAGGSAAAPAKPQKKASWLVRLWWLVLAVFGLFLVVVVIRRWRARRLASKVAKQAPPPPMFGEDAESDLPVLEESPVLSIEPEPVSALPSPLAPLPAEPSFVASPADEPPPAADPEAPVLDLLPSSDSESDSDSDSDFDDDAILPPTAPPERPAGGDDLDEFVFRDGKWRLRDDLLVLPPTSRVDVGDASEVADALHVPEVVKSDDEPPLLDPEGFEAPALEPPADAPPPRTETKPVEGEVSDTVARLVENTKDWTKR